MSLRPEMKGFNLSTLRKLFASKDFQLEKTLRLIAIDTIGTVEESKDAQKILSLVFRETPPYKQVILENDSHVVIANLLAEHDQHIMEIDSREWRIDHFVDFYDKYCERLRAEDAELLRYFVKGRPIFGKEMETDFAYYAYLDHAELKRLVHALTSVDVDSRDEPFKTFLLEGLDTIADQGSDLWFSAS